MSDDGGSKRKAGLMLAALGVVFGDIGTSPLYALQQCFAPEYHLRPDQSTVLGIVSLMLWTIFLIVAVKYVLIVMRADNRGEGGILALVTRVMHSQKNMSAKRTAIFGVLGILGAALLYSDGIITPAISVLSAIEGVHLVSPALDKMVMPISLGILMGLFAIQSRGTEKVGRLFGPVLVLWFFVLALLGIIGIAKAPQILFALNPLWAMRFFVSHGLSSVTVLGAVFLSVTGAEVLYADMGHFGATPVKQAWFRFVLPALVLNYAGQGACLLVNPNAVENLFYRTVPSFAIYPAIIIATAATIIASQAVISGAFSLARQSVQLGFWPRIQIRHTSPDAIGQVYVPFVNMMLAVGTAALILSFKESAKLASAYGIAVSATMVITTCLTIWVARKIWKVSFWVLVPTSLLFLVIDLAFFSSNMLKIASGGWIVVLVAVMIFVLMRTWIDGRGILRRLIMERSISMDDFVSSIKLDMPYRAFGTAVFLTGNPKGTPGALLHNLKHNRVLHETTIVASVLTADVPYVAEADRTKIIDYGDGIFSVCFNFGFSETPNIPSALASLDKKGVPFDPSRTTYFLGREALVVSTKKRGMMLWRKRLFHFMSHNAFAATGYFHLPPNRVVELGAQIEL